MIPFQNGGFLLLEDDDVTRIGVSFVEPEVPEAERLDVELSIEQMVTVELTVTTR